MFDISFGELMVVGVIALIVIGPERLPRVARTVGAFVGRMQRFVAGMKAEIQREVQLGELRQLEAEVRETAQNFEQAIRQEADAIRQPPLSTSTDTTGAVPTSSHTPSSASERAATERSHS